MKKKSDFESFKNTAFRDKAFKVEYESLRPEFELMSEFIKARKKAKLSQVQLAKKLHVQQPAIARLERGGYSKASIDRLAKYAKAIGYSLKISLVRKKAS